MHLAVPNLTEQGCIVVDSTAVSCFGWDGTGQSCYGLHCSALHLTGLDCSGLPELQWSRWQYINLNLTYMQKDC